VSLDENNSFSARNGQIIVAGTNVNVAQGRASWSQNKIIPGMGNANGRVFIFNQ
jgi:hypothetical protein